MSTCNTVQMRLADLGFAELERDTELAQHIAECERCGQFADTIRSLEVALRDLSEHDPDDRLVTEIEGSVSAPSTHKPAHV